MECFCDPLMWLFIEKALKTLEKLIRYSCFIYYLRCILIISSSLVVRNKKPNEPHLILGPHFSQACPELYLYVLANISLILFNTHAGSLCMRLLGQRPSADEGGPRQQGGFISPAAFFHHYPSLQPFLLRELTGAAQCLQAPSQEARLHLQPSLFPILTLMAQLQPGVQDSAQ